MKKLAMILFLTILIAVLISSTYARKKHPKLMLGYPYPYPVTIRSAPSPDNCYVDLESLALRTNINGSGNSDQIQWCTADVATKYTIYNLSPPFPITSIDVQGGCTVAYAPAAADAGHTYTYKIKTSTADCSDPNVIVR